MKGNTKIIVILIVLAAIWFFFLGGQAQIMGQTAAAPSPVPNPAPSPNTPPGTPVMSQPAAVSQPATVSQAAPQSTAAEIVTPTPVAVNQNPAVFVAQPTDAETQGSAATVAPTDPLAGLPSGFAQWAKSLGPNNYAHLLSVLPSMNNTDIQFVNSLVNNNGWGQPAYAPQWNAFVKNYGFPIGGNFSNFGGF